jgi:hypothetical protein
VKEKQMPTYTVHAPPPGKGENEPKRFVFLRDGFHGWAFIAPALWLLVYRLWLGFIGYAVVVAVVIGGLLWLGASEGAVIAAALCISLLFGFEAASIRRWTLARRGWRMLGFVVGEDKEIAEQRFFSQWAARTAETAGSEPADAAPPASLPVRRPAASHDVIGLFPEPGSLR